ncbi:hypothetical protein Tco_0443403 [Tanacetum coccineum]
METFFVVSLFTSISKWLLLDQVYELASPHSLCLGSEKMPKEDVVESSSGNARVKDPQGKEKDDAGKEDALEEDMNKETKFGVRLESNLEKEAEE